MCTIRSVHTGPVWLLLHKHRIAYLLCIYKRERIFVNLCGVTTSRRQPQAFLHSCKDKMVSPRHLELPLPAATVTT